MRFKEIDEAERSIELKAAKIKAAIENMSRPTGTRAHLDEILSDTRFYKAALEGVKAEASTLRKKFLESKVNEKILDRV